MQTSTYFSALICLFISIKFLTLHFINRELIAFSHLIGLALIMKIINSQSSTFPSVHNGLIKHPVFITSRQLALHRQQNGNQQCDCIINLCSTRYLHSEAGTEAYSASKGETSIIHDGLTAEDLRFIPVLFPKSALGTVSSPLYAGRRTSGNGACYSTRF